VVHRVASALHALGATVLRFNFRGVGKSEGRFDQGDGELDDARAALVELRRRAPGARCWIAGFSFGSWIAARLATSDTAIERLILVAPPVSTHDFSMLRSSKLPKLIIQGTADTNCPPEELAKQLPLWSEPKKLILIEGASHFFDRQLGALAEALRHELEGPAKHPAP
jgi:alpha/beta superfamily hydrolase